VSNRLAKAKRIVIKVGSALLVEQKTGQVKQGRLRSVDLNWAFPKENWSSHKVRRLLRWGKLPWHRLGRKS
jgi:hypothetical protein